MRGPDSCVRRRPLVREADALSERIAARFIAATGDPSLVLRRKVGSLRARGFFERFGEGARQARRAGADNQHIRFESLALKGHKPILAEPTLRSRMMASD